MARDLVPGHILTNHHVVANADQIRVQLHDGRTAAATLVGADPDTDLAVLHVQLEGLPNITISSDRVLEVGDVVLAIGNPFGVGQTVTMGIVSATGRSRPASTPPNLSRPCDQFRHSGGALPPMAQLVGSNRTSSVIGGHGQACPNLTLKRRDDTTSNWPRIPRLVGIEAQDITPALAEGSTPTSTRRADRQESWTGRPARRVTSTRVTSSPPIVDYQRGWSFHQPSWASPCDRAGQTTLAGRDSRPAADHGVSTDNPVDD
ncbi:S1C family serine protease [Candidatus Reidiella endopervernicosa]|uniref:Trypsin-like peptidase domain-containing protein n=1 Tax=Candidatus Reidiella endopervernicosa TaxID=2738883 RepID=A0A6N0I150_9GAMM|nr:trypsin-like peptidase domain-containing protein [Candidatus Reidiella endopervernicosa]QKQ28201.1 trypsin-like peptidase domain-containing protein [Candidatus Reidiella endopervernicosa]